MHEPIAHVTEDHQLHYLSDHLKASAELAQKMASEFNCGEWGRLAALWHDLGKYSAAFQQMIREASGLDAHLEGKHGKVDHSTAGAIYAIQKLGPQYGKILAYMIAGHHAGLPDWQSESAGMSALAQRLRKTELVQAALSASVPPEITEQSLPKEKPKPGADPAFWIRLLFSCVVDADFMDTEHFYAPEKTSLRGKYPELKELLPIFSSYMADKQKSAPNTQVNQLRSKILNQCTQKANCRPAIFTLTVPTGGGKTLSSMAFALHHAVKHEKRRIIYVIPYTSIIEQTADQFRKIFGDVVIEHHSNFDVAGEDKETTRSRLASENWDAPIIVTTSVQFFESLFASRTSRCRKLHNIANSVVILDEAQLLPPDFLNPILMALKELQNNYGVTLVLSTATQPALGPHQSFDFDFEGLPGTVEIMTNPMELHHALKRVDIATDDLSQVKSWQELAQELQQYSSVLCIVNRRDDCRELYQLMPEETIHLSALMCGAHRSEVIAHVKEQLKSGVPTRIISTQLVEAGVDVDFPVVYRAIAGLDSIAQAAGRCNREGLIARGKLVVFTPPSKTPPGHLRQAAEIGRKLLAEKSDDPIAHERFERFFRELYWLKGNEGLDKHGILKDLAVDKELRFSYRTAAGKFRIIDESAQAPVLVSYGEGATLIDLLKRKGPERWLMRKLQRYVVNLPKNIHTRLLTQGAISEVAPGIYMQSHASLYDASLGFCPDKAVSYEPDELIT